MKRSKAKSKGSPGAGKSSQADPLGEKPAPAAAESSAQGGDVPSGEANDESGLIVDSGTGTVAGTGTGPGTGTGTGTGTGGSAEDLAGNKVGIAADQTDEDVDA